MKIAVVTDDGITVSQHFGRARYYAVFSIEVQQVMGQGLTEQIDCHGTGTAAAAAHLRMVQPIEDCQALVARGMSWSARECLLSAHIRPILTDIESLDEVVKAYLDGSLLDHTELVH
jgi:predicted Fe-Mo cluster-binding NifX family protein